MSWYGLHEDLLANSRLTEKKEDLLASIVYLVMENLGRKIKEQGLKIVL